MPRNQYLQLYLETNNQLHRPKRKNQCGLPNSQSHTHNMGLGRALSMLAMDRLTGALGGSICVDMVVCMGKQLLPSAAHSRWHLVPLLSSQPFTYRPGVVIALPSYT